MSDKTNYKDYATKERRRATKYILETGDFIGSVMVECIKHMKEDDRQRVYVERKDNE